MKTNAKEFAAALGRVLSILKTRTTLPILSCAKLEAANGKLCVTTTDLDAFAAASCPCEGDLATVCVNASVLNYLVRQSPELIEMKMDGTRLLVKGEGTSRLAVHQAEEFPTWPTQKKTALGINTIDLANCLRSVAWGPEQNPKDHGDFWKQLILVRTTEKSMECCGTNGKEFAHALINAIAAPAQFLFPAKLADLLIYALDTGAHTISLSESWVSTVADNFALEIKLAEDKYIPFERVLAEDKRSLGVIDMVPILNSLNTIKTLGQSEPFVECRFEFTEQEVTILYRSERNDFERSMPHKIEGKEFAVNMDVARAIKVMSHVPPGSAAWLAQGKLMFTDLEHTFALALLL